MRKIKFIIPLLILFLTIGFAAVNFSLSINGDTEITGNLDNFNVYFSRALVNGETNNSIVSSKTQLDFSGIIDKVGNTYTIEYDVTNASTLFDAEVTVKCTPSSEYLLVQNTFNVSSNLSALETRTGTLLLKKLKTISNDSSIYKTITCEIVATPVERESEVTGTIAEPLNPTYIGREIAIGEEKFNVISSTEDTVTMLAKYNLGTDYRQSTTENSVDFSEESGWEYTPGPKEIDIQQHEGPVKTYINNYVSYLQTKLEDSSISGNLISLQELKTLGCSISDTILSNYEWSSSLDINSRGCYDTTYSDWLINGNWWTRSANSGDSVMIWSVRGWTLSSDYFANMVEPTGVRPTITISMELYNRLIKSSTTYKVGREISIGDEKFNVISDNGLTVTMLAKYNLGTDYRQSTTVNYLFFSDDGGWEYKPGPKEIDIQVWSTNPKIYVNEYVNYLNSEINGNSVTGDLITVLQLGNLGCTINEKYKNGSYDCLSSEHKDWLINGQKWWTKSASPYEDGTKDGKYIWKVREDGTLGIRSIGNGQGIRPTITIDKETLNYLESLGSYEIGEEISIENENFNVISQTATTVTMLAQYNLGADFKQTTNEHHVTFSDIYGWEYTPGPKEIDIQNFDGNVKQYINEYDNYLSSITKDNTLLTSLITVKELGKLGCIVPIDYAWGDFEYGDYHCRNSIYKNWLLNEENIWTLSASADAQNEVWHVYANGNLYPLEGDVKSRSIRPTVTISKETLKYLASQKKYEVGQEVSIGDEKFNVISDNGTTISMLAQYNLGADYRQTTAEHYVNFSDGNGWEYTPGPKEIDIQSYDGNAKQYIGNYVDYLKAQLNDSFVSGNLISLKELQNLGCLVSSNYSWGSGGYNCYDSSYKDWLINNQYFWTRSALVNKSDGVWRLTQDGGLDFPNYFNSSGGMRPVITIAKSAL